MLFDGMKLTEGSEIQNLTVDTGTSFPASPSIGEIFYRTDGGNVGLYVYDGTIWNRQINSNDSTVLPDILTPGTYKSVSVNAKGLITAGTNPTTLAGYGITNAQPLDADLTAIANLSGTSGLLKKTASDTWTLDTSNYISGNENITLSGDVSGTGTTSLTVALATTGVAAGSYGTSSAVPTVTIDSKGRITAASNANIAIDASAVTSGTFTNARISSSSVTQHQTALTIAESQITDGSLLARVSGNENISGTWTFNNPVTGATPTIGTHLTTKDYVDSMASGVTNHMSVQAATTANITLSGTQTIDGVALTVGKRVLVKDQTTSSQNGVYVVSAGTWARAADFDGAPQSEATSGSLLYVETGGTVNGNSSWVLITPDPIVIGTTSLTFSLFGRPDDYVAGNGLTKTGSTFDVGTASSSRIVVNTDNIDLATVGTAGTYAACTTDAYGRVTAGANLAVLGDVTGTSSGSGLTLNLQTIGSFAGQWGNSGQSAHITVNNKGLVTAIDQVAISIPFGNTTSRPTTLSGYGITDALSTSSAFTGDVTGTIGATVLSNTGVTAGTYDSVTVDAKGRVTAGSNPGGSTPSATYTPYDIASGIVGKPTASATVLNLIAVRAFNLPATLTGSQCYALTAATASATFSVKKNGTQFGTIVFAAAGTVATFTGTATSFAAGDKLTITAPGTQDATLSDISYTLSGNLQ